tara:strand:+ start:21287 stop:22663 length:1377 start_codon:yes stop_codon:yes gene_type:complete
MKLNYLLISALALISLNSFSQNGFEDFDDIYSDNTSGTKNSDANTTNNATEFSDGEDAGAWIENDEYYDPSYNAKTNSDSSGNTYITNNYYGDYEYSSRFRRFDNRISGYSYFDPFYTNVGYYSPNAWGYGRNFRRPGWNMGWSSYSGWNVGYNYGWNNNGWGNNGWGNNGWGNNGWGNNGYAYNQGFRDGVYASNGDNNNRSRYYGRRESRGAGTRLSSTYGNRRSNSRTINSSGIIQNTNTYAGRQSAGNSIRTARPARAAAVIAPTRASGATMRSVGAPVRRTSPARSSKTRVGDKSPSVISAKPSRALRTSSTPSSKRTGVTVTKERAVPTRRSTTPKRRSIGKPSRRTVGSSPSRTTPSRGIPTRTIPSRTSPRRTTPLRTAPTRTSPTRTSPSRTTPGRSRPTRTSPSRNSGSSRSSGSSRTSSPSRSSSSPSRSSSSGSSRGSSSSRGGRR